MSIQKSELRRDYIQEKYVIIAPQRKARPHDLKADKKQLKKTTASCGFCPANLKNIPNLYKKWPHDDWQIKVIPNIYPAVSLDNESAYGQQEVVIETPDHTKELEQLSVEHLADLLTAYAERTKEISQNPKIDYILIFKNNGGIAGASLEHTHSQIFATQFLPPHILDKSQRQQEYKIKNNSCVYCDVIKQESKGSRLIYQDEHIIAFAPYASMFNYEVWIMPLKHRDNITELTDAEKLSFAKILKVILQKIGELNLPYNFYFHQIINDKDQHLYMKVIPRGSVWAGVEIGSGLIINPIDPDDAAEFYRQGI